MFFQADLKTVCRVGFLVEKVLVRDDGRLLAELAAGEGNLLLEHGQPLVVIINWTKHYSELSSRQYRRTFICGKNLWQRFCLKYPIVSVYEFRNDLCKSHTLRLRMAGNIACAGLNVFNVYKDHDIVIEGAVSM